VTAHDSAVADDHGPDAPHAARRAAADTPAVAPADRATTQDGDEPSNTAVRSVRLVAPSAKGVFRMVALVTVWALGFYLAWRVRGVLRLCAISLFLALALIPIVDALDRRIRAPRAALILALYVLLAGGVAVLGSVLVPSMAKEVQEISRNAPRYASELRANATFRHYDDRYHIATKLEGDLRRLPQLLSRAAGPLKDVTVQATGVVGQLVTVLAVTFLLLLHGREYVGMALRLTGPREARYRSTLIDVNRAVANYMLGNVAISIMATLATWIVLSILGVPYALSLGVIVGFFDLIPLVGATIGAIVVALATATVDFPLATIVWVAFIIVYQRVEDYVVQPLVYGRALKVNPLVTILAVLIGASLLGILGALLGIPIAAAVQIILRDWWADRTSRAPAEVGG